MTFQTVTAGVEFVPPQPIPILAILRVKEILSGDEKAKIAFSWGSLWDGQPPFPVVVLGEGEDLEIVRYVPAEQKSNV